MNPRFSPEDKYLADYLLGRLTESERQALTELFLDDDEVYRATLAMEEALIDAYARGELEAEDARLVELRLLQTDAGRAKLRTARALLGRQRRAASRHRLKWVAAAAAALVLASGIGLGIVRIRHRAPEPAPSLPLAAIMLRLGAARGADDVASVAIPATGATVLFSVPLAEPDRAPSYEVRLRTSDGREVVRSGRESRNGAGLSVQFEVERAFLVPGRYEVEVTAVDSNARRLVSFGAIELKR